jgi:hypothetical protein
MLNIHHDESRPSRVTVAFEHGAISFMMSKDATFEDLADRLDRLGKRRHGKPVAIAVKLAAAFDAHRRGLISGLGRGRGVGAVASGDTRSNLAGFRASHRDRTSTTLELANAGRQ